MPSGRDSFRRNRVAPFVLSYFTTSEGQPSERVASSCHLPAIRYAPFVISRVKLERFQERNQVILILLRKLKVEARVVEIHRVHQSGCGSVMEKRRARGETTQYRSFDLTDMVEPTIDQSLAEIGCGFAVVGRHTRSWIRFADGDLRQKAHI